MGLAMYSPATNNPYGIGVGVGIGVGARARARLRQRVILYNPFTTHTYGHG